MTRNEDGNPIPSAPRIRRPPLVRRIVFTIILLCGVSLGWLCLRTTYFDPDARVSFSRDATPGTVTFIIHDQHGNPIAGVPVNSESYSGTAGEISTNPTGRAVITPGESEVLAVYVDRQEFRLRPEGPLGLIEYFCSPSCDAMGLTFHVTFRK
jgi:hypothetical protein